MRTTVAAALCATGLSIAAEAWSPPSPVGSPCRALTQLEIDLAGAPTLYAVVDGPSRQIELKAKGIVLRRFPLRDVSLIGRRRADAGPSVLARKVPLIEPPPRTPPRPGDATDREKMAEPEPLTVAAMPARYRLVFKDGLSMMVHPGGGGARWERLLDSLGALSDRLRAWVTVLAGQFVGAPRHVLIVELSTEEARAFYWAVRPPLPVLLRGWCPASTTPPAAPPRPRAGPRLPLRPLEVEVEIVEVAGGATQPLEEETRLGPVLRSVVDDVGDELVESPLAGHPLEVRPANHALGVGR